MDVVRFTLNVSSTSRQSSGSATLQLQPAPPRPSNGSCTATVDGGRSTEDAAVALVDVVVVSCSHWTDHSGSASPLLEYHVFVGDTGGGDDWYPVYRGSRQDVSFYVSPLGADTDVVSVYVDVIDSLGSTRRALHASVLSY